jgi:hypothetical protein
MDLQPVGWKGMDCTNLSKDRDKRQALKNAVINRHVPQTDGIFGLAEKLLAFQEVLCSIKLVF